MSKEPIPFNATGNDGRRYGVDVVYDMFDGIIGRIAWFTGREWVERRPDGTFVVAGTGVVLTPIRVDE
jgi:hypothetical protein